MLSGALSALMKRQLLFLILFLSALAQGAEARANALSERLALSGFGTFALIQSDNDQAGFVRDIGQPKGANEGVSVRTDSRLGLQASLNITRELDIVAQGLSQYRDTDDFSPELMLAFMRYSPDPELQWRLGRLGWDVDLMSDSRYVGYAYPWIRPPVEHFGILQLTYIDGADVTLKRPLWNGLSWARFFVGHSESRLHLEHDLYADIEADRIFGGHLNHETGAWHFRAGYTRIDAEPGFGGERVEAFERATGLVADDFFNEMLGFGDLRLYSLGASYDPGTFQLQTVWNRNMLGGKDVWVDSRFVTAAWRIDRLTPYVIYSHVDTHFEGTARTDAGLEQSTWSLGLRHDVTHQLALKAQLDFVDTQEPGVLWRGGTNWGGGQSTLLNLGLDFIF